VWRALLEGSVLKKLFITALLLLPIFSFAGSATGLIDKFVVHYNGSDIHKYDVSLKGNAIDQPSECNNHEFWGDLTTEAGRAQYSLLLAAVMAERSVQIDGQSTCFQGREAIRNVRLIF
jgi:hypothetical protein